MLGREQFKNVFVFIFVVVFSSLTCCYYFEQLFSSDLVEPSEARMACYCKVRWRHMGMERLGEGSIDQKSQFSRSTSDQVISEGNKALLATI